MTRLKLGSALIATCLAQLVCCAGSERGEGDRQKIDPSLGVSCQDKPPPSTYTLGACELRVANPTRLLVSTTDFSTGAVSIAHLESRHIDRDVALGTSDGIPFYLRDQAFLVHRFNFDFIEILDSMALRSLSQHAVDSEGVGSTNPHALAFRRDGMGFATLYGKGEVQALDFSKPPGQSLVKRIDLTSFADADGNPDVSLAFACGDTIFVSVQRLGPNWQPAGRELLIPIDGPTCSVVPQSIELLGLAAKQVRRDPADASGRTVLILSSGLERLNLATGEGEWAVDESVFKAHGLERLHSASFALHNDTDVYIAAYSTDFTGVEIWRVSLNTPTVMQRVLTGFHSVEQVLEIIGDELWLGDTTIGASGLRVFDLRRDPPTALAGPLSTGLPPYSMIPIP